MYRWQISLSVTNFYLPVRIGSNEATTRYEEKEARSVRKTNRMPEGKIRAHYLPLGNDV